MAVLNMQHPWVFAFGLLGNLISFMVYLAPVPTFMRIYKKKSTEGFQSVPYLVALFSAMLWIFYAFIKTNSYLLITINAVGCFIETVYIVMFMTYAPRKFKIYTTKLLLLLNVGVLGLIVLLTLLLSKGIKRVQVLGWICVGFSVSVFAAPLSIMRLVIRTKSVEFMPFSLSFFLTLSAIAWFAYGLVTKDIYVALPNVLGFLFGVGQMVLYSIYKATTVTIFHKMDTEKTAQEQKPPELVINIVKLGTTGVSDQIHPIKGEHQTINKEDCNLEDRQLHEGTDQGNERCIGTQDGEIEPSQVA